MGRFRIPTAPVLKKDYSVCPWTKGLRIQLPTQEGRRILNEGVALDNVLDVMFLDYHYNRQKSDLVTRVIKEQGYIVRNDNEVMLRINIPFCFCRCFNCKRVMTQINEAEDLMIYYYDALKKEVDLSREIIKQKCYIIKAVCYTGNLLSLNLQQMEELLALSAYSISETSVEIEHPHFVTQEKLELLKKYNVSRIILNPLTFNMTSMRKLCRKYDFKEFYNTYRMITSMGFEINISFVAGLLDEHELQLTRSLQSAIDMGATNIDIYARNCPHNPEELPLTDMDKIKDLRKIQENIYNFMISKGYQPYFVYNSEVDNVCIENIGYTVPGKKCEYITDIVEGISTIIGCGTDAQNIIIKNLHKERVLQRNTYDVGQYILGIEEYLEKKKKFFDLSLYN